MTKLAQPQACSCWTTELAVFSASVNSSAPKRPVARPNAAAHSPSAHTPQRALQWRGAAVVSLSGVPRGSYVAQLLAPAVQARDGDSRPIDMQFATILVHTRCTSTNESSSSSTSSSASTAIFGTTPMIQVEHILNEEPIGGQGGDEEGVSPTHRCACPRRSSCLVKARGAGRQ